MVGLPGLEPGTSRLSVERSSQLSYRPILTYYFNNLYKPNMIMDIIHFLFLEVRIESNFITLKGGDPTAGSPTVTLLRLHPSR